MGQLLFVWAMLTDLVLWISWLVLWIWPLQRSRSMWYRIGHAAGILILRLKVVPLRYEGTWWVSVSLIQRQLPCLIA
ncbi:hypothetical protein LINGRAHAP2_LOCUS30876 [Linum grandiflorum]